MTTYAGYRVVLKPQSSALAQLTTQTARDLHLTLFYYASPTENFRVLENDIPQISQSAVHEGLAELKQKAAAVLTGLPLLETEGVGQFGTSEKPQTGILVTPHGAMLNQRERIAQAYDEFLADFGISRPRDYALHKPMPPYTFGSTFRPHVTIGETADIPTIPT